MRSTCWIHVYARTYICTCICTRTRTRWYIHMDTHTCTNTHNNICTRIVRVHTYVYVSTHTHTRTYTKFAVCIHTNTGTYPQNNSAAAMRSACVCMQIYPPTPSRTMQIYRPTLDSLAQHLCIHYIYIRIWQLPCAARASSPTPPPLQHLPLVSSLLQAVTCQKQAVTFQKQNTRR